MMMTRDEALARLRGNDLLQLGMDAGDVRQRLWPETVVTYTVGFPVEVGAGFSEDAIAAAVERGAMGLMLSGSPGAELAGLAADVAAIHARFPELTLAGSFAGEFAELKAAGLGLFAGAFDEGSKKLHRAAHAAGLPSVAVLMLRSSDSAEEWVALLELVAALHAETQGFLAVEPRIEAMERALDEVTGAQYLKMVAMCRLYLPTVPHVQVDWAIFGPKVLQVALRFGADDAGLVVASARDRMVPSHHSGEEELRRIIRDAGFAPSQRDAAYGRHFVY